MNGFALFVRSVMKVISFLSLSGDTNSSNSAVAGLLFIMASAIVHCRLRLDNASWFPNSCDLTTLDWRGGFVLVANGLHKFCGARCKYQYAHIYRSVARHFCRRFSFVPAFVHRSRAMAAVSDHSVEQSSQLPYKMIIPACPRHSRNPARVSRVLRPPPPPRPLLGRLTNWW